MLFLSNMDYSNKNLKYWLAFSKQEHIGSTTINRLWNHFGCIKDAWHASNTDFLEVEGLQQWRVEKFFEARKNISPEQALDEIVLKNIKVITIEDENYPYLLKQIFDPPVVLFVKGDLSECNFDRTLAIVGSRRASEYALDLLSKIINDFAGTDITIVSGMALGVDACAHRGALRNNLKTIAVLGSGFDYVYPPKNKDIFEQTINGNGAVLSEFYPSCQPLPQRFPMRNRIVSGLSKGTLIAEASLKSGALITANLTLEQNRELMCIPGMISNPNTEGIYKLLKQGAGLVTNAQDVLDHLKWSYNGAKSPNMKKCKINLLDNEAELYEILKLEALTIDKIVNQSSLSIGDLMVTLTSLELKGLIKQLPGEKYVRTLN
jgi:DNA processing protein